MGEALSLSSLPLSFRGAVLLIVLAGLAWVDLGRARRGSAGDVDERRFIYGTILACAIVGSAFGVLMDQITCTLSPEYFRVFKELPGETELQRRRSAADLGFAAGMVPGLIAGICLAIAGSFRLARPLTQIRQAVVYLAVPFGLFLPLAICIAWYQVAVDPTEVRNTFRFAMTSEEVSRMLAVWGIHQAAYLSGFLGTVAATVLLRKKIEPSDATS